MRQNGDNGKLLALYEVMANSKPTPVKVRPTSAKEISVLAWIQDAYGNVLVVQQAAGKKLWSLPGGKVRGDEPIKDALRREIQEELGLTVVSARVIDLFDRPERCGLAILFQAKLRKGRLKLPPKEIRDARFVSKLPLKSTPSVRYFWARQFPSLTARGNNLDF
jgi:ADP-ribose pyrophosphatase YjhB (NUDIX family)